MEDNLNLAAFTHQFPFSVEQHALFNEDYKRSIIFLLYVLNHILVSSASGNILKRSIRQLTYDRPLKNFSLKTISYKPSILKPKINKIWLYTGV
jgi:hypothetical protein